MRASSTKCGSSGRSRPNGRCRLISFSATATKTVLRYYGGCGDNPRRLALQAEASEEVAAFVYAAISQLPAEVAEHYLARCLVASNSEVARHLADSVTPLIIVDSRTGSGRRGSDRPKGHYVLAAFGQSPSSKGSVRKLGRPSREGIELALIDAGVNDKDDKAAKRFATGIIKKPCHLASADAGSSGRVPQWAGGTIQDRFLPHCWPACGCKPDADKVIMSRLSDMPYEAFAASMGRLPVSSIARCERSVRSGRSRHHVTRGSCLQRISPPPVSTGFRP